jgi:Mn-dependent DtxR family transcriptional regulator
MIVESLSSLQRTLLRRLAGGYVSTADLARVAAVPRVTVQGALRELARRGLIEGAELRLTEAGRAALMHTHQAQK